MVLLVVTGISGIVQKINVFVSMVNFPGKMNTEALQIENKYRHNVCFFKPAWMDTQDKIAVVDVQTRFMVRVAF